MPVKSKVLQKSRIVKNGCWEATGSLTSAGYGQITENKKYWTLHRYSYTAFKGEIPEKSIVRHLCHNSLCCNPDHLETGTHADNWQDSSDTYLEMARARRSKWNVAGVEYETCREAVSKTGVSMNSLVKYTIDGVFDLEAYRSSCRKIGRQPSL